MTARNSRNQSGDTLVEVLLATLILSIIIAASFTLVNRASRINQNSSERSEALFILQQQAEQLKYHFDNRTNSTVWSSDIASRINSSSPPTPRNECGTFITNDLAGSPVSGSNPFTFDTSGAINNYSTSSPVPSGPGYHTWIEGYEDSTDPNQANFYIHVCWEGVGSLGGQSSTVLYRLAVGV